MLSLNIVDGYFKANNSNSNKCSGEFICKHLHNMLEILQSGGQATSLTMHCIRCLTLLYDIQIRQEDYYRIESKSIISGSAEAVVHQAWESVEQINALLCRCLEWVVEQDAVTELINLGVSTTIYQICVRYCSFARNKLYSDVPRNGINEISEWNSILLSVYRLSCCYDIKSSQELRQLLLELWWFVDTHPSGNNSNPSFAWLNVFIGSLIEEDVPEARSISHMDRLMQCQIQTCSSCWGQECLSEINDWVTANIKVLEVEDESFILNLVARSDSTTILQLFQFAVATIGFALDGCRTSYRLDQLLFISNQVSRKLGFIHNSVCPIVHYFHFETMLKISRIKIMATSLQFNRIYDSSSAHSTTEAERDSRKDLLSTLGIDEGNCLWDNSVLTCGNPPMCLVYLAVTTLNSFSNIDHVHACIDSLAPYLDRTKSSWHVYIKAQLTVRQAAFQIRSGLTTVHVVYSRIECLDRGAFLEESIVIQLIRSMQLLLKQIQAARESSGVKTPTDYLQESIEADVYYLIGRVMYIAGGKLREDKKGGCLVQLLNAAKINPVHSGVFTYLGHYYTTALPNNKDSYVDLKRGLQCYLKAISLNPLDEGAGVSYMHYSLLTGDLQAVIAGIKKCDEVIAMCSYSHWSHAIKGQLLYYLHKNGMKYSEGGVVQDSADCSDCVKHFQIALEFQDDDIISWFYLGCCYAENGQYHSAHCAFSKVFAWGGTRDEKVLCMMGDVQRKMCLLHDSLNSYTAALTISTPSNSLVAIQGVADVCLSLSYQYITWGWYEEAHRMIETGISSLDKGILLIKQNIIASAAVGSKSHLTLLQLKGKLCSMSHQAGANAPAALILSHGNDSLLGMCVQTLTPNALLETGVAALLESLSYLTCLAGADEIETKQSLCWTWYEAGVLYYYQMIEQMRLANVEKCSRLKRSCIEALTTALTFDKSSSECWNMLGIVLSTNLSYRCYLAAIHVNSNILAYANLGHKLLYSAYDTHDRSCILDGVSDRDILNKAREFFSSAQLGGATTGTMSVNSVVWLDIGQALDAESRLSGKDTLAEQSDSYHAALEVTKTAAASYMMVITWLRINGLLQLVNGCYKLSNPALLVLPGSVSAVEVFYQVERPVQAYLTFDPYSVSGWVVYSWALQIRGDYAKASRAMNVALLCGLCYNHSLSAAELKCMLVSLSRCIVLAGICAPTAVMEECRIWCSDVRGRVSPRNGGAVDLLQQFESVLQKGDLAAVEGYASLSLDGSDAVWALKAFAQGGFNPCQFSSLLDGYMDRTVLSRLSTGGDVPSAQLSTELSLVMVLYLYHRRQHRDILMFVRGIRASGLGPAADVREGNALTVVEVLVGLAEVMSRVSVQRLVNQAPKIVLPHKDAHELQSRMQVLESMMGAAGVPTGLSPISWTGLLMGLVSLMQIITNKEPALQGDMLSRAKKACFCDPSNPINRIFLGLYNDSQANAALNDNPCIINTVIAALLCGEGVVPRKEDESMVNAVFSKIGTLMNT